MASACNSVKPYFEMMFSLASVLFFELRIVVITASNIDTIDINPLTTS